MKKLEELLAKRRAAMKKRIAEVAEEAQGMIRAVRRKMDDLEARLKRDPVGASTGEGAGVEEALTLAYRLSRLGAIAQEDNILQELEKAAAKIEEPVAARVSKPEAAEIPGMDDDKAKGGSEDE